MQTFILLSALLLGMAAETSDEAALVRRLVDQLDAPTLVQREDAEKKLLELGPRMLNLLPPLSSRTPAEIQQRVGRIRQKLEQAASDAVGQASLITLQADGMPTSKVLAALAQQSGNAVIDDRSRFGHVHTDPSVKVDFFKKPFWQAFDSVLDQVGMTVYPYGEGIHIINRAQGALLRTAHAAYAGPFRLEPSEILADRDLRLPTNQSLRLMIEIAWEPRLKPIYFRQRMADVSAIDDQGMPLNVENSAVDRELPIAIGRSSTTLELSLVPPPRPVEKIATLKGKMHVLLPGRVETFRFDHLDAATNVGPQNVDKRIGAVTVTLEQSRKIGAVWEVRMRVRFDQPGCALESHRGWIQMNEAYVEGPDGQPHRDLSPKMTRQEENQYGWAFRFSGLGGPPRAFVYRAPGSLLDTEFTYEFKDVLLP